MVRLQSMCTVQYFDIHFGKASAVEMTLDNSLQKVITHEHSSPIPVLDIQTSDVRKLTTAFLTIFLIRFQNMIFKESPNASSVNSYSLKLFIGGKELSNP
mgnify:CR=1 FL=1